ncbi:T9SS-dependent choice-of-anchor J family protein [Winogradskyella sp. SM1960]|uniref:T9SS-dependent choice-of-anchor J family protein n=1 Tax=Winogradskyella sp. SM1960 TaxID=2865955 RepID=UPI001CD445F8|nr:choice-of-anchor J domain-containing protein [Winogradskyella sp. SM1960]
MKKILLLLFLVPLVSLGQNLFSEDFEEIENLTSEGWTLYNDTNTPQPTYASIITDAWNIVDWVDEDGNFAVSTTSWFTVPASADRWLVTPSIEIPEGSNATLSFKIRSHDEVPYADGYTLKISTGTASKADLSTDLITVDAAVNDVLANITATTIDLSAYNGETIFLAWVNTDSDRNLLSLDDISIDVSLSVEDFSEVATAIYPNPAKESITLASDNSIKSVEVFNNLGQVVLQKNSDFSNTNKFDISNLTSGVYIMTINSTDGASQTKKFIKE